MIEEKGHDRQGGQNDFKKALEDVENVEREMKSKGTVNKGKKKEESELASNTVLDLDLVKTEPEKLYPIIYYALKRVLKEWGEAMDERPGMYNVYLYFSLLTRSTDHIKRTHQGKLAAATQVQSAEYLKPLFKQLRSRVRKSTQFQDLLHSERVPAVSPLGCPCPYG